MFTDPFEIIKSDPDVEGHWHVLMQAQEIFQQKNILRGPMWREFPPSDKIRELRERVRRIEQAYSQVQKLHPDSPSTPSLKVAVIDDAIDIINYSVFLVRQLHEGATG